MNKTVGLLRASADRLLDLFVPSTSVAAIECDTAYRCHHCVRQRRQCCYYPGSGVRCGSWVNYGACYWCV